MPARSTRATRSKPSPPGRRRNRRQGSSGDPAAEALEHLVSQFSERSSFVRELVQNSLDAGAGRVDMRVEQVRRRLKIEVIDDGEGMDRRTIEGPLLTLFTSSKERDRTRIGKFGVGFVSLFAVRPELVVLDTARDGVHHRVVFDADQRYTLAEVDEPFEGTRVTLWIRTWGRKAGALATELYGALRYWCRFARAEIWTEGRSGGAGDWDWPLQRIVEAFDVDATVSMRIDEPGFRAVLGWTGDAPPRVGYYHRGLTLLETREDVVPGVTFRVEADALEHTLTRDNVRRDQGHDAVIRRLRELARGPLRDRYLAALRRAATSPDPAARARHLELLELATAPTLDLPRDLPCLLRADGGLTSLDELDRGRVRLGPLSLGRVELFHAPGPGPLVDALAAEGRVALLDTAETNGQLHVAARLLDGDLVDLSTTAIAPSVVETPQVLISAAALLDIDEIAAATFAGGGAALADRLCIRQDRPGALERVSERELDARTRGCLVVAVDHPAIRTLFELDGDLAVPLLAQILARAIEAASSPSPERAGFARPAVIAALLDATESP